jgi:hypothetical protein
MANKYYNIYRIKITSKWGDLYGLEPSDLSDAQIEMLSFKKLIEIASEDFRAEKAAAYKIMTTPINNFEIFGFLEEDEINGLSILKTRYNKALVQREVDIDLQSRTSWRSRRDLYVHWKLMENYTRHLEIIRWKKDLDSIIDERTLDYGWMYENDITMFNSVVSKITEKIQDIRSYGTQDVAVRLIRTLPKEPFDAFYEVVKDKYAYRVALLGSFHTPNEYKIKMFREIAGKKRGFHNILVRTDKDTLSKIPTVTRLKLFETVLHNGGRIEISDASASSDISELLFGSMVRHYERVQSVVALYKRQIGEE